MAFSSFSQKLKNIGWSIRDSVNDPYTRKQTLKIGGTVISVILLIMVVLMIWWSMTPNEFDPVKRAEQAAVDQQQKMVTGYTSVNTAIALADTLLHKSGGYLSNDMMPPSIWMDNMPNWEFGVLVQLRDYTRSLRNDLSRSQSQSVEDKDLIIAEPQFNFNSRSWLLPSSEREYRKGLQALQSYQARLSNDQDDARFYARADNLAAWLDTVQKRLGSLSQRLSASVGQMRVNLDLPADLAPIQPTENGDAVISKTPWYQIDDVFFEARGSCWALIHLLKAAEHDFNDILKNKNALLSLRQIIRELEATQKTVHSPIILNGGGFGLFANHSLVMASYISRANAAIIDLSALLKDG